MSGGAGAAGLNEADSLGSLGGVRVHCSLVFSNLQGPISILCDFWKRETFCEPITYVHFPLDLSLGQDSGLIATHRPGGPLPSDCAWLHLRASSACRCGRGETRDRLYF